MDCAAIALEWRRLIALAVYFFPRAGELEALESEDVTSSAGSSTSTEAPTPPKDTERSNQRSNWLPHQSWPRSVHTPKSTQKAGFVAEDRPLRAGPSR
jgi:hypothetical protein